MFQLQRLITRGPSWSRALNRGLGVPASHPFHLWDFMRFSFVTSFSDVSSPDCGPQSEKIHSIGTTENLCGSVSWARALFQVTASRCFKFCFRFPMGDHPWSKKKTRVSEEHWWCWIIHPAKWGEHECHFLILFRDSQHIWPTHEVLLDYHSRKLAPIQDT